MGYSRKILPSPHRGGWISRLFVVKYYPGFPGFLNKNPYSHTDFQKWSTHTPKIQIFLFSHSGFRGKMCKIESGIPDFLYIRSTDILYGGKAKFIWNSPTRLSTNFCVGTTLDRMVRKIKSFYSSLILKNKKSKLIETGAQFGLYY